MKLEICEAGTEVWRQCSELCRERYLVEYGAITDRSILNSQSYAREH